MQRVAAEGDEHQTAIHLELLEGLPLEEGVLEDESAGQVLGGDAELGIVGLDEEVDVLADIAADDEAGAAEVEVLLIALGAGGILGPIGPELTLHAELEGNIFVLDHNLCGER